MKGRKSFITVFLTGLTAFMPPQAVFASGYPVIDLTAAMNAMTQIFNMYDQINATIESVENGYKQIEQAVNMVKSFNFENLDLTQYGDWSDPQSAWENIGKTRTRLRQVGGYASQKVDEINAIKHKLNSDLISFNGVSYSIGDLVSNDESKNIYGLAKNIADYAVDTWDDASRAYAEGLSYEERAKIMKYYGVTPEAYYMEQACEGLVKGTIDGSLGTLAPNWEKIFSDQTEQDLRDIELLKAGAEGQESEVMEMQVIQEEVSKVYGGVRNMTMSVDKITGMLAQNYMKERLENNRKAREKEQADMKNKIAENKRNVRYHSRGF